MSRRALLLAGVVVVVVAVVAAALWVLESPAEVRRQRLDERRVQDLRALADTVDVYWSREGMLPPDLATLTAWQGSGAPPTDPETGAPYRYRVTGDQSFELCATFATATAESERGRNTWPRHTDFWRHPADEHCFELEADEVKR